MTIGIIVPAYQAEAWLPATIASVQAQTITDWRCVIVDDGSSDGTSAIARACTKGDERFSVLRQANGGVSRARNAGVRHLGEVDCFAFLDSDDLWLPTALESLAAALSDRLDAAGAYGLAEYVDQDGVLINTGLHPSYQRNRVRYRGGARKGSLQPVAPDADLRIEELVVANPVWPSGVALFRAAAVRVCEGFDETFPTQEDWLFYAHLVKHGPIVALDTATTFYRRMPTGLTGDSTHNYVHQDRVRRLLCGDAFFTESERAAALGAWRHLLRRGAGWETRQILRAIRAKQLKATTAALVRAAWTAGRAVRPGIPAATPRAARWRARGPFLKNETSSS